MPFVQMFHGSPVRICGRMILERHTPRGGGRTRRPPHASPLAFSTRSGDSRLQEDDKLMAFLDDVYVVNPRQTCFAVVHSTGGRIVDPCGHTARRQDTSVEPQWVATARV